MIPIEEVHSPQAPRYLCLQADVGRDAIRNADRRNTGPTGNGDSVGIGTTLIFAFGLLAACIGVFVWVARRVRKGGGGTAVGVLGATHEMLSSDRRRAAETVIRRNAGESDEEEPSSDPVNRARRSSGS